jgi:hypothetical protein
MVFPELLKLKEAVGDKLKEKLVEIIIQAFFSRWMDVACWISCKQEDLGRLIQLQT